MFFKVNNARILLKSRRRDPFLFANKHITHKSNDLQFCGSFRSGNVDSIYRPNDLDEGFGGRGVRGVLQLPICLSTLWLASLTLSLLILFESTLIKKIPSIFMPMTHVVNIFDFSRGEYFVIQMMGEPRGWNGGAGQVGWNKCNCFYAGLQPLYSLALLLNDLLWLLFKCGIYNQLIYIIILLNEQKLYQYWLV